jgi:hypothetical protein
MTVFFALEHFTEQGLMLVRLLLQPLYQASLRSQSVIRPRRDVGEALARVVRTDQALSSA